MPELQGAVSDGLKMEQLMRSLIPAPHPAVHDRLSSGPKVKDRFRPDQLPTNDDPQLENTILPKFDSGLFWE
ncbi:MAG: hypothetical protein JSS81_23860 [Acidobacteria bacterium]|nr:hypothetical protein [Acidobacteriota bacterium]